jgi:hypothetical protein
MAFSTFTSSMASESACLIKTRSRDNVSPRQSPGILIMTSICSTADLFSIHISFFYGCYSNYHTVTFVCPTCRRHQRWRRGRCPRSPCRSRIGRLRLVVPRSYSDLREYLLNDGSRFVVLDHGRCVVVTEASRQEAQSSYAAWPAVPARCQRGDGLPSPLARRPGLRSGPVTSARAFLASASDPASIARQDLVVLYSRGQHCAEQPVSLGCHGHRDALGERLGPPGTDQGRRELAERHASELRRDVGPQEPRVEVDGAGRIAE